MDLGIDFGTSFTKMAGLDEGRMLDLLGTGRLPSAAAYVPFMDRMIYGQAALNSIDPEADNARFFKLDLIRKRDFRLGKFSLKDLLFDFFAFLHREFVVPAGLQTDSLTLSVPNNFGLQARRLLLTAAQEAFNLSRVFLLPEPVAALMGYNASHPRQVLNGDLLVIDVGGGTSDFSFLSISADQQRLLLESQFQVGQDAFSGSEIDRMVLRNILADAFQMQYGEKLPVHILNEQFSSLEDKFLFYRWMQMAEEIKIILSDQEEIRVNYEDFIPGHSLSLHITQDIFRKAIEPAFIRMREYWHQSVQERARALGLTARGKWNLDAILLLGGASQTRGLPGLMKELCPGVPVVHPANPDTQVIRGLCSWQTLSDKNNIHLKTIYPFRFYMEKGEQDEHTLEELPFDTANLELDYQGRYEVGSVPVNSAFNLAAENDRVLMRVFELAEEDKPVQTPGFLDQNLILQIEGNKSQTGDNIHIYLNLARGCLELDDNNLLSGSPDREDSISDRVRQKQRTAFNLISAYRFMDEMLVEDYGRHLEKLGSHAGSNGEEAQETALYKIMSLMQFYKGK